MKIILECCLCDADTEIEVNNGWDCEYGETSAGDVFCPKHATVARWADAQCSGCVGGFGDCDLWRKIREETLPKSEIAIIENGVCPSRTNGTLFLDTSTKELQKIDLSERADAESSKCFADALREMLK